MLVHAARAAKHWAKIQVNTSEHAFAIRLQGIGHQMEGDYSEAIKAYQSSLELLRTEQPEIFDIAED